MINEIDNFIYVWHFLSITQYDLEPGKAGLIPFSNLTMYRIKMKMTTTFNLLHFLPIIQYVLEPRKACLIPFPHLQNAQD